MKILFMGTTIFSCAVLDELEREGFEVIGVVTQPDRPVGRKKELTPSLVKKWAIARNIPVYQPNRIKKAIDEINAIEADLIVTCAYGQIVPLEILNNPPLKAVNIHASILPKYRGGAPIHKAIMNGETETGLTLMKMDAGMDSGDILYIETVPINIIDTFEDVEKKLMNIISPLIKIGLNNYIKDPSVSIPQDESNVSYAYALTKEEELISFTRPQKEVYDHIRSLIHWPVGYALLEDKRVKFHGVKLGTLSGKPGEILNVTKEGIEIGTADKSIIITTIQPFGKSKMSSSDFYNGFKDEWKGKVFNETT